MPGERGTSRRQASGLSVGEGLAPRLAHGPGVSLKGRLSVADSFASGLVLGVVGHFGSLTASGDEASGLFGPMESGLVSA